MAAPDVILLNGLGDVVIRCWFGYPHEAADFGNPMRALIVKLYGQATRVSPVRTISKAFDRSGRAAFALLMQSSYVFLTASVPKGIAL